MSIIFSVHNIIFFHHETSPHGLQKMNLIIPSKEKNEKSWILKTVYGKHSIYFSDLKKDKFSCGTKSLGFLS